MSYETVINDKDTTCQQCGAELPKGEYVIIDKREPKVGTFCTVTGEIDALCWIKYFDVKDEPDPYKEIARDNTLAALERYHHTDDDL